LSSEATIFFPSRTEQENVRVFPLAAFGRGKRVFDKTPPATIDIYNSSKLFLAWDGDPSILRSVRLSCWFEPHPQVINNIMQEQEADPN